MNRCLRRERRQPSCSCLVHAFRSYPHQTDLGQGCASPDCLVKSLDSITVHQFLQAIGGLNDRNASPGGDETCQEPPILRSVERRRRRRTSRRPPL